MKEATGMGPVVCRLLAVHVGHFKRAIAYCNGISELFGEWSGPSVAFVVAEGRAPPCAGDSAGTCAQPICMARKLAECARETASHGI